jgi:hypothetical protein
MSVASVPAGTTTVTVKLCVRWLVIVIEAGETVVAHPVVTVASSVTDARSKFSLSTVKLPRNWTALVAGRHGEGDDGHGVLGRGKGGHGLDGDDRRHERD